MWGYSFAVCLFLFGLFLVVDQINAYIDGGEVVPLWGRLGNMLLLLAVALILLTKKSKKYGAKIARLFALMFGHIVGRLNWFLPSYPQVNGDSFFDPMDCVADALEIIALFVGYAVGKYIAKKIKDSNMATVKEELSQS